MKTYFSKSWQNVLSEEIEKDYFKKLMKDVDFEYQNHICYPPKELIFNAFNYCDFDNLKIVIIGQDPYHGRGEANGLAFSVNNNVKTPPSLRNIFKEIDKDYQGSNDLKRWAIQGVLLLNATLTVRENAANSHKQLDWNVFTTSVIKSISEKKDNIVFLLWGKFAQNTIKNIKNIDKHLVLECGHPSFAHLHKQWFENKHFKKANHYLSKHNKKEIIW